MKPKCPKCGEREQIYDICTADVETRILELDELGEIMEYGETDICEIESNGDFMCFNCKYRGEAYDFVPQDEGESK